MLNLFLNFFFARFSYFVVVINYDFKFNISKKNYKEVKFIDQKCY